MAEMNYCGPHGIEWERFLSWSRTSRDAALLWQQQRQQVCPGCGTDPADFDPARGGHPAAFVATVHNCPGCAALHNGRERLQKKLGPGDEIGLRRQVPKGVVP